MTTLFFVDTNLHRCSFTQRTPDGNAIARAIGKLKPSLYIQQSLESFSFLFHQEHCYCLGIHTNPIIHHGEDQRFSFVTNRNRY